MHPSVKFLHRMMTNRVAKAILQKGHIAAVYVRLNRIRWVATMCTPSNTCFLWLTRFHAPKGYLNLQDWTLQTDNIERITKQVY